MKQFSQGAFEKAKNYLYTYGRPLDQRRFEYHFEGGSQAAVLEALTAFQNGDGGFGKALEPEFTNRGVVGDCDFNGVWHFAGGWYFSPETSGAVGGSVFAG